MKEKIANLIRNKDCTKEAGQILTLISEEIEKVENPYKLPLGYTYQSAERMRRTILNLLSTSPKE